MRVASAEKQVFSPRCLKAFLLGSFMFICGVFIVAMIIEFSNEPFNPTKNNSPYLLLLLVPLFFFVGTMKILGVIRKRPKITLTHKGLQMDDEWGRMKFVGWDSVAPFSVPLSAFADAATNPLGSFFVEAKITGKNVSDNMASTTKAVIYDQYAVPFDTLVETINHMREQALNGQKKPQGHMTH